MSGGGNNWTVFTSGAGAAGSTDYVKDEFLDTSLEATSNGSLTSNANTNPQSLLFSDTDSPTYKVKTLLFQDLILVEDRSQWISGKPTYRPVFQEGWPAVNCYIFGDIATVRTKSHLEVTFNVIGDGVGVNGIIRRAGFLIQGNTAATATAQITTDGVAGATLDFSSSSATSDGAYAAKSALYFHATSNETNDLHDIRCTSLQAATLTVSGIQVYYENSGANINVRPGSTYVNKNKVTTTVGATMGFPAFGGSLGGVGLIYKSTTGGVTVSALSASTPISIALGSSGTNLLNVSTGSGSSYTIGSGVLSGSGSTQYFGVITNISTDALTVSPTLTFGVSGQIYRYFQGGHSYAIGATLHQIYDTIDIQKISSLGATIGGITSGILPAFIDPNGRWAIYGNNVGIRGTEGKMGLYFLGGSGFIQIDSRSSAVAMEVSGMGTLGYTLTVDNLPASSYSAGLTGTIAQTLFTDAGAGVHTVRISPNTSQGVTLGVNKIDLYDRVTDRGVTFGGLAKFNANTAYTERNSISAQVANPGTAKRTYADEIYLKGSWTRGLTSTLPGNVFYYGVSAAIMQYRYYGKNVGIIGADGGGTLSIDGVGVSLGFGGMHVVASEGFHTVQYTVGSGGTAIISAIDVAATQSELGSLQNFAPLPAVTVAPSTTVQVFTTGSGVYIRPEKAKWLRARVIGGGGGSGGTGGGGTGGTTSFGTNLISCAGGVGGSALGGAPGVGGAGGAASLGIGAVGLAVSGGPGGSGGDSGTVGTTPAGGHGASTPFGGGGTGGTNGGVSGGAPPENTGAGAGGAANDNGASAGGGGAGAYVDAIISLPNTSYDFSVGAAGTAGTGGGAAGAKGVIIVEEHYS